MTGSHFTKGRNTALAMEPTSGHNSVPAEELRDAAVKTLAREMAARAATGAQVREVGRERGAYGWIPRPRCCFESALFALVQHRGSEGSDVSIPGSIRDRFQGKLETRLIRKGGRPQRPPRGRLNSAKQRFLKQLRAQRPATEGERCLRWKAAQWRRSSTCRTFVSTDGRRDPGRIRCGRLLFASGYRKPATASVARALTQNIYSGDAPLATTPSAATSAYHAVNARTAEGVGVQRSAGMTDIFICHMRKGGQTGHRLRDTLHAEVPALELTTRPPPATTARCWPASSEAPTIATHGAHRTHHRRGSGRIRCPTRLGRQIPRACTIPSASAARHQPYARAWATKVSMQPVVRLRHERDSAIYLGQRPTTTMAEGPRNVRFVLLHVPTASSDDRWIIVVASLRWHKRASRAS